MPIKIKITDLEDNSSIYMYLRQRSERSESDIGRNINNKGPENNGVSTCNYGDDERSNFWFWYEYDVAPRDNPAMPYNYECGKEVYNYGGASSYNYGGNVPEKGPYHDVGLNNQISPYNYECGKEVYNYGGGNAGITSYNYGRNVPDKGPYYDVGVSAYNCGKEVYNYGGVTSYNYGEKVPDKGPYYDVGVNNQISPYQYGNKEVASCNYQCTAQISPNCYSGGFKGVSPSPYQGEVDMKKSPMECPPRDIPRITSTMNCPPRDIPRITSTMNCPPRDIPRIMSTMNCPPRDIPRITSTMNCPPRDIPRIMSTMNCPPRDIPRIMSTMNCPPRDIPRITSPMNCPPRDIPRITSPMNCPPRDIPRITRLKCKRKCCKKLKTQGKDIKITPMSAEGLSEVGPIAKKYLKKNGDFIFGIHFDKEANAFKVGRDLVMVDGNDLVLNFEEEVMRYTGTEGLWRLITQDMSYFDEDYYFSDEDWVVYMELLLRTNYHQCSDTVAKDDDPENITPMFLCCLGLGAGGVAVGGAGGLAVGGAGGLVAGGAGGLVVGGAVGGAVGFAGGVGFTLATLLGLKFAANLGKVLTSALYTVLSKKANFIAGALGGMAQAGVNIYGKIGQLKDGIYDALKNLAPKPISWGTYLKDKMSDLFWGAVGKIVPISPGGGPDLSYLKFWEWFKCPTCILFKELDELLRLLISLQKPETSPNKQCGFNQNCLLFWILERIVACFGKEGGCEKLIDWLKINVPLIISSGLLRQLIENLPWGYQQKTNPICGPQTKPAQQDKDCSNQGQRYKWYLDLDIKLEAEVRVGVEVLDVLFKEDPQFFEKIEGSINLPCKELNEALKSLLEFLKNYFQIESQGECLI
ncbi:uncharacterized protein LOC111053981 [Nilaparvata lugens]|uniref:uncharacterized protein LOC111053981 n=1 Tax=Nilaparvata lugens TaxID=108931 RepID=UPI00193E9260|nr:uncharacterized protein LOC111053981 [Nilaparvata lugens]